MGAARRRASGKCRYDVARNVLNRPVTEAGPQPGSTAMNLETPLPDLAFSHVGLFVHDLELMEGFYRRVLGFTVTDRGELPAPSGRVGLVFLSRDPREHHQLVLATGARPRSSSTSSTRSPSACRTSRPCGTFMPCSGTSR